MGIAAALLYSHNLIKEKILRYTVYVGLTNHDDADCDLDDYDLDDEENIPAPPIDDPGGEPDTVDLTNLKPCSMMANVPKETANDGKWVDPMQHVSIFELHEKEREAETKLGEATKEARKPLIVENSHLSELTFLGRKLGAIRNRPDKYIYIHNGVIRDYSPKEKLDEPYFGITEIVETLTPKTCTLTGVYLEYNDYSDGAPSGKFKNNAEFLALGREIREDLMNRLGCELQEFRFFAPVWPWVPGGKASSVWSGPIPKSYLSDEEHWQSARNATASSRTVIGDFFVSIQLSITYYDEYHIGITISSEKLRKLGDEEYYELGGRR